MQFQKRYFIALILLLIMISLGITACGRASASSPQIEEKWETSAHSDVNSPSFTRWNEDDPPVIPTECAKCHSTPGYLDFLGEDGSHPGQVESPAPTGSTIECVACHNEAAESRNFTVMPSGVRINGLGQESNCMECHQGRASSAQVVEVVTRLPQDEVDPNLSLPKIHNNPAGAIFYGAEARGGGEYPDKTYAAKFYHGFDTCITCHDPHTLQVKVDNCSACHLGATTIEGVRNIRLSNIDYDGDGDITEGLSGEIETMEEKLLKAIQLYVMNTDGADSIIYDGSFMSASGDPYTTWSPRSFVAAYNYQYAIEDPGGYSHNAKYILQLLYDSLEDLGGDVHGMTRPESDK